MPRPDDGDTRLDVLVVEDDPDMADVMLVVLRQAGYTAASAENGEQALAIAKARRPALVLLDMLMPVMDGWTCARALRRIYGRTLPIVVVTAAEHVRARGDEIDADGVLAKPFEVADLLQLVDRHLQTA